MAGKRLNMVGKKTKRSKKKVAGGQSTRYHRPGQPHKRRFRSRGKWA